MNTIAMPETMWPVDIESMGSLPQHFTAELTQEKIDALAYPWELLNFFINRLKEIRKTQISKKAIIAEETIRVFFFNISIKKCHIDTTQGPVIIEDDVVIHPYATITGPACIRSGAVIGEYARVSHSYVGRNTHIGERSSVNYCIIGDDCHLHASNLENSLLGNHVTTSINVLALNTTAADNVRSRIGAEKMKTGYKHLGATIGADSFISSGCSFMPGIKVGQRVFVLPNITLYDDPEVETHEGIFRDNIKVFIPREERQIPLCILR